MVEPAQGSARSTLIPLADSACSWEENLDNAESESVSLDAAGSGLAPVVVSVAVLAKAQAVAAEAPYAVRRVAACPSSSHNPAMCAQEDLRTSCHWLKQERMRSPGGA